MRAHLEKLGTPLIVHAFQGREGSVVGRALGGKVVFFDRKHPDSSLVKPRDVVRAAIVKCTDRYDIVQVPECLQ